MQFGLKSGRDLEGGGGGCDTGVARGNPIEGQTLVVAREEEVDNSGSDENSGGQEKRHKLGQENPQGPHLATSSPYSHRIKEGTTWRENQSVEKERTY